MYMPEEVNNVLFSEEQLRECVTGLGMKLTAEYSQSNPLFLCVLKGASFFFTDLVRRMQCPLEIDFIRASSYVGTDSSGTVKLNMSEIPDIAGRDVVLVEDIVDTAQTLSLVKAELLKRDPLSVKTVCLLDKPSRRVVKGFTADYVGYSIDDYFVVGYGLDCDQKFRNLPYIGVMRETKS